MLDFLDEVMVETLFARAWWTEDVATFGALLIHGALELRSSRNQVFGLNTEAEIEEAESTLSSSIPLPEDILEGNFFSSSLPSIAQMPFDSSNICHRPRLSPATFDLTSILTCGS